MPRRRRRPRAVGWRRVVGDGRPGRRHLRHRSPTCRCCTRSSPPSWPPPGPAPRAPRPAPRCPAAARSRSAEGHRPGPAGLDPCPALGRRRRRPRPQAPQLPPADTPEDDPAGPALGAVRPGRPRAGWPSSTSGRSTAPKTKDALAALGALGLDGQGAGRPRPRDDEDAIKSFRNLPDVQLDPGRRAQRLRRAVQRLDRVHPRHPARATAGWTPCRRRTPTRRHRRPAPSPDAEPRRSQS